MNLERRIDQKIILLLTGNLPGSGASTQRERLASYFNYQEFTSGYIRRAIAFHWQEYRQNHQNSQFSEAQVWNAFQSLYQAKNRLGASHVQALLAPYMEKDRDEEVLQELTLAQQEYAPDVHFWDQLPEQLTYEELLEKDDSEHRGAILDAKNATIINELVHEFPQTGYIIIKILLEVSPDVSAQRVARDKVRLGKVQPPQLDQEITPEELLSWWDKPTNQPQLRFLEDWKTDLLNETKQENLDRITEDNRRYAQAFGKDESLFSFERKKQQLDQNQVVVAVDDKPVEVISREIICFVDSIILRSFH